MWATSQPENIKKIALINFGGIGDEILFSSVIRDVRAYFRNAHIALFLEDRSQAIAPLLTGLDEIIPIKVQGEQKSQVFFVLRDILRKQKFDTVISAGSSPFIPILLFEAGIPNRVGFDTGLLSRLLLTCVAPLNKNTYAGAMYYSLAQSFLQQIFKSEYTPADGLPALSTLSSEIKDWASGLLNTENNQKNLLVHPGVSQVSIDKGIYKSWASENWAQLIQELTPTFNVFLCGGPDDQQSVDAILQALPENVDNFQNLYGQTKSLTDLAGLIEASDCLIGADSSPLHIATAYNTPVVAMFGPTNENKLVPDNPVFKAVTVDNLDCRPCLWDVRQTSCDNPVCLDVSVEAMKNAITSIVDA